MTTKTPTPTELAETYFAAWKAKDEATLRSILADDVSFVGPMATVDGVDAAVGGLLGMATIITDLEVLTRQGDDHDVVTVFHLHTKVAPPALTANWSHVEDGKITQIRVAFDPRELLAAG